VQGAGRLERSDRLKLDVAGTETVEKPSSLTEQDRDQLDLQHGQQACPQAFSCRAGAVQHDVAVPGGRLCLRDARSDAVGHEADLAGSVSAAAWCVGTKIGTPW